MLLHLDMFGFFFNKIVRLCFFSSLLQVVSMSHFIHRRLKYDVIFVMNMTCITAID